MDTIPRRQDVTLANWRNHPFSRWSFSNVREIVPTAHIVSDAKPEAPSPGHALLADLSFAHDGNPPVAACGHLEASHTDGFVVMRDGQIVAEWFAEDLPAESRPHVVFSVSKSITGVLAGIAVDAGLLDPDAPVAHYVAVRRGSAYDDATVRHLLDMTVALEFEEDYLDKDGAFDRYRRAMLWNPERDLHSTETMLDVLSVLPRAARAHGQRFYYASPNTDMAGLVLEAATGRRFADYLAETLWQPMGAYGSAYVTVDRVGAARAAGGICVTVRDLARFGDLVLNRGVSREGRRLVSEGWIRDLSAAGNREAWVSGNFAHLLPKGRYRSFWYATGGDNDCLCAMGIHGQYIWIDPTTRVVLAKTSSRPLPSDDGQTLVELDFLRQIASAL